LSSVLVGAKKRAAVWGSPCYPGGTDWVVIPHELPGREPHTATSVIFGLSTYSGQTLVAAVGIGPTILILMRDASPPGLVTATKTISTYREPVSHPRKS
jgi:hypothetical protein